MSEAIPTPSAILVCDRKDDEVRACLEALSDAGAPLEIVPDVYAAMSRLAQGAPTEKVLVDVRWLDGQELAFLQRVSQFFPACEVVVPIFAGTLEKTAVLEHTRVRQVTIAEVVDAVIPKSLTAPEAQDVPQPSLTESPVPGRLSTDGGPDVVESGPALHEVVRERMGASDSPPIRRAPPTHVRQMDTGESGSTDAPASNAADRAETPVPMLSPEEMDALLTGDEARDEDPASRGGDGGGVP